MLRRILIAVLVFAAVIISVLVDDPVAANRDEPGVVAEVLESREVAADVG